MVAKYGRFAGREALKALRYFELMRVASELCETPKHIGRMGDKYPFGKVTMLMGLQPFVDALKNRNAGFFEELAELMRWMASQRSVASPVWEKFIGYIWWHQKQIRYGERKTPITRKEVADYLEKQYLEKKLSKPVSDTFLSKMIRQCGLKLVGGKPGPKRELRRKAGRR